MVSVGHKGTAEVKCGLVRPDDRSAVADVARHAGAGAWVAGQCVQQSGAITSARPGRLVRMGIT